MEKFEPNKNKSENLSELMTDISKLEQTKDLDENRISWMSKIADLYEKTNVSLEDLKKNESLDNSRIDWWQKFAESEDKKSIESNKNV